MNTEATVSITMGRKVQTAPYESAEVQLTLNNVPAGATQDQIAKLLETGNLAYSLIATELKAKVAKIKENSKKV